MMDALQGSGEAVAPTAQPDALSQLRVRRVYEPPAPEDGQRILVDRLWPRGLSRSAAQLDVWLPDLAPSTALRRWYGHDPVRWEEFARRYYAELAEPARADRLTELVGRAATGPLTLLTATRDAARSHAEIVRQALAARLAARQPDPASGCCSPPR